MALVVKDSDLDWEFALQHIKFIVCKHSKAKDLRSLMNVNESWREDSLREQAKRCSIWQLYLPYEYRRDIEAEAGAPILSDMVDAIPNVPLLIFNSKFLKAQHFPNIMSKSTMSNYVLKDFKDRLPHEGVVVMRIQHYLSTQGRNREDTDHHPLCLFFPRVEGYFSVRVALTEWLCSNRIREIDRIADELGLDDYDGPNAALLLFVQQKFYTQANFSAAHIIHRLRNRILAGKETIWAGGVGDEVLAFSSHCKSINKYPSFSSPVVVALRIIGPRLRAWSTIIATCYCDRTIDEELRRLKERIDSEPARRHFTGLLFCSHIDKIDIRSQEIMSIVELVFPDIPFVGLFPWKGDTMLIDQMLASPNDGNPTQYRNENCLSVMIISYQ